MFEALLRSVNLFVWLKVVVWSLIIREAHVLKLLLLDTWMESRQKSLVKSRWNAAKFDVETFLRKLIICEPLDKCSRKSVVSGEILFHGGPVAESIKFSHS